METGKNFFFVSRKVKSVIVVVFCCNCTVFSQPTSHCRSTQQYHTGEALQSGS